MMNVDPFSITKLHNAHRLIAANKWVTRSFLVPAKHDRLTPHRGADKGRPCSDQNKFGYGKLIAAKGGDGGNVFSVTIFQPSIGRLPGPSSSPRWSLDSLRLPLEATPRRSRSNRNRHRVGSRFPRRRWRSPIQVNHPPYQLLTTRYLHSVGHYGCLMCREHLWEIRSNPSCQYQSEQLPIATDQCNWAI